MKSELILRELKIYGDALDELIEQIASGAKVDLEKARLLIKAANAKRAIVDTSLDVNLARPELALIIEAEKPRREIASQREWNGAMPGAPKQQKKRRAAQKPAQ